MSLLLLFRPRRRRNLGASKGDYGGGGQRLRVFKNPAWKRKNKIDTVVDVAEAPSLDEVLTKGSEITELVRFQSNDVPLLQAQQASEEALKLLNSPYFAVRSDLDWAVPDYLMTCGCVLETYMTPEQARAWDEDILLLLLAAQ